jgi:hypothetical protein
MWYTGARLTARDSGSRAARMTRLQFRKGNFPPRNTLKSLKTAKESRSRRRVSPLPYPVLTRRSGGGALRTRGRSAGGLRKRRAPPPYPPRGSGQGRSTVKSKGNFPPRKALKSLETEKESRSRRRGFSSPFLRREVGGGGLWDWRHRRSFVANARVARPEPRPDWRWPIRANLLRPLAHTAAEPAKSIRMR